MKRKAHKQTGLARSWLFLLRQAFCCRSEMPDPQHQKAIPKWRAIQGLQLVAEYYAPMARPE